MKALLEMREKLQGLYGNYSLYIDKAGQFLLALVTFFAISNATGYFKVLSNPVILLALAVVCMFLPLNITVLVAALLILGNMYKLSLEILALCGAIILIMYILFLRFVPKQGFVVLMTPLLIMLKMPYLVPIALGLTAAPASVIAAGCGIVIYFMLHFVSTYAATMATATEDDTISRVSYFIKNVFQNKEMYLMLLTFLVITILVYVIRRLAVSYSWEIAIAVGVILSILLPMIGGSVFDVSVSLPSLLLQAVLSLIVAVILEFFLFTVDYSKTKQLQYEDDEYYYYVKAVPKIRITPEQKEVKHFDHWKKGERPAEKE